MIPKRLPGRRHHVYAPTATYEPTIAARTSDHASTPAASPSPTPAPVRTAAIAPTVETVAIQRSPRAGRAVAMAGAAIVAIVPSSTRGDPGRTLPARVRENPYAWGRICDIAATWAHARPAHVDPAHDLRERADDTETGAGHDRGPRPEGRDPASTSAAALERTGSAARRSLAAVAPPAPQRFAVFESKLRAPALRPGLVSRAGLVNRLRAARSVRLATLVAPAGYGKTTLLAQWAARDERPFVWLSVDARDNDPLLLVRHLATRVRPGRAARPGRARRARRAGAVGVGGRGAAPGRRGHLAASAVRRRARRRGRDPPGRLRRPRRRARGARARRLDARRRGPVGADAADRAAPRLGRAARARAPRTSR